MHLNWKQFKNVKALKLLENLRTLKACPKNDVLIEKKCNTVGVTQNQRNYEDIDVSVKDSLASTNRTLVLRFDHPTLGYDPGEQGRRVPRRISNNRHRPTATKKKSSFAIWIIWRRRLMSNDWSKALRITCIKDLFESMNHLFIL